MDGKKQEITAAVAAQIRYYRKKHAMSQEALALKANLNPAYFGQVERDLKCPTVDTLYKIASALDISPADLLRSPVGEDVLPYGQRAAQLLSRVPPSKREAIMGLLESMVEMLE
mgnify:CR=1 FL=1